MIRVRLKKGILDPQGKAVNNALHHLSFNEVSDVRIGKLIEMQLDVDDRAAAENLVEDACKKLLTNPVIEDYTYDLIEEQK